MNPLVILGAVAGAAYVYKKKPEILPKFLQPKDHAVKIAALGNVTATSAPTPSHTAGLDPNMSTTEVASANGLLSNSADPAALYAMASDYSDRGYINTSKALIAKADALSTAKKAGATDDQVFAQMMAASGSSTASQAVVQNAQGVSTGGPNFKGIS